MVTTVPGGAEWISGRRVLITGHTGFKGSWLSLWLSRAGALVTGIALDPPTHPAMFDVCGVGSDIDSHIVDVRNRDAVSATIAAARPELVFHMAAQPIVRLGYREPVETFDTNVMGTVHVLDACRRIDSVSAVVVITSDKCYENHEWVWPYRESDALGGSDPYSSSKACAEHVAAAYGRSYFGSTSHEAGDVRLATARAGNVIGGGDWAADRLLPDAARAFSKGEAVAVRNPHAVRPWQHVLEPLRGYLMLAERLVSSDSGFHGAWNFGPDSGAVTRVDEVMDRFCVSWGEGAAWRRADSMSPQPKEATLLTLDCSKALHGLGWRPVLSLDEALRLTAEWYAAFYAGDDPRAVTLEQIDGFERRLKGGVTG